MPARDDVVQIIAARLRRRRIGQVTSNTIAGIIDAAPASLRGQLTGAVNAQRWDDAADALKELFEDYAQAAAETEAESKIDAGNKVSVTDIADIFADEVP